MSEIYIQHKTNNNIRVYKQNQDEGYSPNTDYPVDIYIEKTNAEKYLRSDRYLAEIDTETKRKAARANLGIAETDALNWGNINGDIDEQGDLINLFKSSSNYQSSLPSSAYMPAAVGNIPQGTTVRELTGTQISELLDKLLFKEQWPGVETHHTVGLTQLETTVEVGSTITAGYVYFQPSRNASWVTASQIIYYIDDILFSSTDSTGTTITNPDLVTYLQAKQYRHYARISYPSASFTVVSNFGTESTYTIPSGIMSTPTVVVNVKFPIFAYTSLTQSDNGTGLTKQALQSNNTYTFTLLSGSSEQQFLIPTTTRPRILEWNEDQQAFTASNTTWFAGTPEQVYVNGVQGNYIRYTYGDQYRGDTTVQISW